MLLAVGGVLFWILVAIVCIWLFVAVEYEKWGWATISVIATFALLGWLGDFSIWNVAVNHPLLAVACAGGYVLLGIGWSFGKWYFFVLNMRDKHLEAVARLKGLLAHRGKAFARDVNRRTGYEKPVAKEHKGRILTWMIYWPWSLVWTILNDPIKKFFKYIFRKLQATYQRIADRAYAGVEDLPPPPDNPPNNEGAPAPGMRECGFVVDDELLTPADLDDYLNMPEEAAIGAIEKEGMKVRVMKRDGMGLRGDRAYIPGRVNLEIKNGVVVRAWIG